jgi:ABC-type oligopeptide transport system ATPase subunit
MGRALTVDELTSKKFKTMKFTGPFADSFGIEVDTSGSWIIYGESGHGKTEFSLQLAKYLTSFGKVAYDTIEEGARLSFQKAIKRQAFQPAEKRRFSIISEPIEELRLRLKRQKSPDIIFIDSLQFSLLTKVSYNKLVAEFPRKLFIWISHAEGRKPRGSFAEYVEYHSDMKIRVEGFRAIPKGRFEASKDFIINEALSSKYWNEII